MNTKDWIYVIIAMIVIAMIVSLITANITGEAIANKVKKIKATSCDADTVCEANSIVSSNNENTNIFEQDITDKPISLLKLVNKDGANSDKELNIGLYGGATFGNLLGVDTKNLISLVAKGGNRLVIGTMSSTVDNFVLSVGNEPRIRMHGGAGNYETIIEGGNATISSLSGTSTAYICVTADGTLFRSSKPCV